MKHITRVVAAAGALALAATTATVGASAASAADQPVIGFSPISMQIPAMGGIWGGVQGFGASQGLSAILADPNFNPSLANQQITGWLRNHQVNGWWAISTDGTALSSAIALSSSMHIPGVINTTPELTGRSKPLPGIAYSSLPYAQLGEIVGRNLGKCMLKTKQTQAVYIAGTAGAAADKIEYAAAVKALKKVSPKLSIIATVAGNGKVETAQTAVSSSLQAHPKVTAFLGLSDESAVGAVQALKAAGKKASATCVTDIGGSDQAVALYKAGSIYAIGKIDFEGDLAQNILWLKKAMQDPANTPGVEMFTPTKEFAGK
ncbi:MAG: substrate-binding domain-containing protein [Actinomycetales bacterium]|nr:substrate-binding domain-containing protein [Actinomycetales bacterium]